MNIRQYHRTFWVSAVIGLLAVAIGLDQPMTVGGLASNTSWLAIAVTLTGCLGAAFSGRVFRFGFAAVVMLILMVLMLQQPFSFVSGILYSAGILVIFVCAERSARPESAAESAATWFGHGIADDAAQRWELHREVQRARHFNRPLSLAVLSPAESHADARTAESGGNGRPDEIDIASLGDLLAGTIKACDILMFRDGLFLLVLPETEPALAKSATRRLARVAGKRLGIQLQIGIAGFPTEEVTLTGLWELARSRLNRAQPDLIVELRSNVASASGGSWDTAAKKPIEGAAG